MSNSHIQSNKNICIIISFLCVSLLSIAILMPSHILYGGADLPFHLHRLYELILMLRSHKLLPNFAFNQFHGSASMFLYPYFSMIPLAILSIFIKSRITVLYLFFMVNVFISLCICFYSSYNFNKSVKISYLFSIIYSLCNTFLGYSFISMDIGVELSYVYLPLVFFGFFELLRGKKYSIEFIAGCSLLIFSHILNTIIAFIFLAILLITYFKEIKTHINIVVNMIKNIIWILCITSIEWIPILKFLIYNHSNINPPPLLYLSGFSNISFLKSSLGGLNTYGISFFATCALILSIFFYRTFNALERRLFLISIITIFICSSLFPWKIVPRFIQNYLKYFQFTFRFLIIPILFLSYLYASIIVKHVRIKIKYLYVCSIVFAIFLQFIGQVNLIHRTKSQPEVSQMYLNNHPNGALYNVKNNNQINELLKWSFIENYNYYPKDSVSIKNRYVSDNYCVSGDNKILLHYIGYNKMTFIIAHRCNKLILPLVCYNHENSKLYIDNRYKKYFINKRKLITLYNVPRGHHVILFKN